MCVWCVRACVRACVVRACMYGVCACMHACVHMWCVCMRACVESTNNALNNLSDEASQN